jgi:hypothetical protein
MLRNIEKPLQERLRIMLCFIFCQYLSAKLRLIMVCVDYVSQISAVSMAKPLTATWMYENPVFQVIYLIFKDEKVKVLGLVF